jgi:hypothetical protein
MKKIWSVLFVALLFSFGAMAQPYHFKGKSKHRHDWHKHIKKYNKKHL